MSVAWQRLGYRLGLLANNPGNVVTLARAALPCLKYIGGLQWIYKQLTE